MISLIGHFIGLVGMFLVVLAFYQSVTGTWTGTGLVYNVVNLCGATLLIISLCINFNLGSFIVEMFWIAISIKGLRAYEFQGVTKMQKLREMLSVFSLKETIQSR